jgi:hypothetical protein
MEYRYVIDCDVAETLLRLPSRQREELIRAFRHLAADPHQRGDSSFKDSTLRVIQKQRFGRWLISFWPNHPVKELRIVGVQLHKP